MQKFLLQEDDTLEFYVIDEEEHRWRVTAPNGEKIASSTEAYSSMANAKVNFNRDRSHDTVELYQDKAGDWRWRARACHGDIVAASGEGYFQKSSAIANLLRCGYLKSQIIS